MALRSRHIRTASLFDPLSDANIKAHWREPTGNSSWSDRSGSAYVLSQGTAGKQPTYNATGGPGNRSYLSFDGVDDFMSSVDAASTFMTTTAQFIELILRIRSVTLDDNLIRSNHAVIGDAGQNWGIYARDNAPRVYPFNWDTNEDGAAGVLTFAVNTWCRMRRRLAGGTMYLAVNGTEGTGVTTGASASVAGAVQIGAIATGVLACAVDVAEIILGNSGAPANMAAIDAYCAARAA